ncbi:MULTISPECIES: dihydroorotase [unclassified Leptolyngbya]|uniref:dihydroorotase n=1 Tax=unclassified Leptolyngbya TaxID=2650499 RepID=UPI00168273A7|nr:MULTISPECIES: dihydroorotase [unclassified Leptolyngbya]MBD1910064.1 dihydroorotase [Leptolyngbya sp. FACHB-8]MBD2158737.1 dihydroorotase [Leptolyngbya sp. FACHB-16]
MAGELLRQVRVLDPLNGRDSCADVWLESDVVRDITEHITDVPEGTEVRDGTGLVLGPGLVDLYSHSGEPGNESRETMETLARAAIAGGFTQLTLLPDTDPTVDSPTGITWATSHWPATGPRLHLWGALTQGVQGQQMTELADLAAAGAIGFADGQPLQNPLLLRRVLEYAHPLQKPVALWGCDRQLQGSGVAREGMDSIQLGLPGTPALAETTALATLLECVATIGTPVHVMRVSTARSVELIADAKQKGLPITASTTWLHLLLNTSDLKSYNPNLRVEPPLGTSADQMALIQGVESGVIDAIAIDHAPYTYEEKTVAFAEAPPGVIGLELALPLLWQGLVASEKWSALTLWKALSLSPQTCLQQTPTGVTPGAPADLVLFDPSDRWRITPQVLQSRSYNTPWLEQVITGRVIKTWTAPR